MVPYQGFPNSITSHLLLRLGSESISEPLIVACWEGFLVSTAGDPNLGQALVPQTVCLRPCLSSLFCPLAPLDLPILTSLPCLTHMCLPPLHHLFASLVLPCSALLLSVPVPGCHLFGKPGSALVSNDQVTLCWNCLQKACLPTIQAAILALAISVLNVPPAPPASVIKPISGIRAALDPFPSGETKTKIKTKKHTHTKILWSF